MYYIRIYKLEIVWSEIITGIYSPVVYDNINETERYRVRTIYNKTPIWQTDKIFHLYINETIPHIDSNYNIRITV